MYKPLVWCLVGTAIYCQPSVSAEVLEEVRVTAHPLADGGLAQSTSVLSGDELAQKVQGSLGETIAGEAGINSASFGAAVGRPVIHGLGGTRVKTTQDRIDSLDVSVSSGDHAVTIEPFIADQINILKGASTLLYGSNAIGGVVDVDTGRIVKERPENDFQGKVELRATDNADATNAVIRLDGAISDNIVLHFDGFKRDADDYDIPGYAESAAFRAAEEEHEHEEEHDDHDEEEDHHDEEHDEEEAFGTLEGSNLETSGGAIGFTFVGERGFAGVSVSKLDSQYGLIGHSHAHEEEGHDDEHEDDHDEHEDDHDEHEGEHDEHEDEEGTGMIDMKQTRVDFEAQLNDPFAGFESINFRVGINDYQHTELEGNGEVGTLFTNDAWEGRVELVHKPIAQFDGSFGLQLNSRDYSAVGEEALVPPVTTDSQGLFWVGQRTFGSFDIESGLRFDHVEHKPSNNLASKDFDTVSASLGLLSSISDAISVSALLDYSSRAPSIEELYSDGPHLATLSYEIGNLELEEESAVAFSLSADYKTALMELSMTLYHMQFDDFIYQTNTGLEIDELPVFNYQQNDAKFTGIDSKAIFHLADLADGDFDLNFLFDTVRATVDSNAGENDNLPRIPATRLGASLSWSNADWDTKLSYLHVEEQNDVASLELPTESYSDISLYLSRSISLGSNQLSVFIHGRNLADEEQRNHASFVKDLAPAPGRRVELGLRMQF